MAGRAEEIMDLDLNLGPVTLSNVIGAEMGHSSEEAVNVGDWVEPSLDDTIREIYRERIRLRRRWRYLQLASEPESLRLGSDSDGTGGMFGVGLGVDGENGDRSLQAGEGSVAPEERNEERVKNCESHVTLMENGLVDEKGGVDKSGADEGSFFDCNICMDLAKDPIVTCCGHLFCWPCIYRWLHIYGEAKECPVCKGEVTLKNVTPIYGRGNHTHVPEEELEVKIPVRPSAKRVESLRQTIQRRASSFPVEEMIQHLGARFELTRDSFQFSNTDGNRDLLDRSARINRLLNALRRERSQGTATPPSSSMQNVADLTQDRPEIAPLRRHPPFNGRGQFARDFYDRHSESHHHRSPPGQSEEHQPAMVDDRDSVSSIAAVIHGESQTVDTTIEIDSGVFLSTSSSRRINDASRSSDVDSIDSRSLRRRRLN